MNIRESEFLEYVRQCEENPTNRGADWSSSLNDCNLYGFRAAGTGTLPPERRVIHFLSPSCGREYPGLRRGEI